MGEPERTLTEWFNHFRGLDINPLDKEGRAELDVLTRGLTRTEITATYGILTCGDCLLIEAVRTKTTENDNPIADSTIVHGMGHADVIGRELLADGTLTQRGEETVAEINALNNGAKIGSKFLSALTLCLSCEACPMTIYCDGNSAQLVALTNKDLQSGEAPSEEAFRLARG